MTDNMKPVQSETYGMIIDHRIEDGDKLDPETSRELGEMVARTLDHFLYQYGPERGIRMRLTLEAL